MSMEDDTLYRSPAAADPDDDDEEEDDEEDEAWPAECGMTPDGSCMLAGSEDCDECPVMLEMLFPFRFGKGE